ncbi:MAG: tripartite tricarboxylate transporter TctB family protein [Hyphomicrobiales bacterium]|nr:tripartite tricarboxylate transporter TctB family protein [Hyphomicrobiales bacterium]
MTFRRYQDVVLGAFLTLSAILFITVLIPDGVHVPEGNSIPSLSPDFWIKIIIWCMLGIGLALMFHGIRAARLFIAVDEGDTGTLPLAHAFIKVVVSVVLLFVYWDMIEIIGMPLASMVAVVVFTMLCGERRWKVFLPLAVILPTVLYYFFLKVAHIPMPLGIFDT